MKRISIAVIAALVAIGSFANPKALQKAWLKGTTDKAPIYYNPGETMVFTIEPMVNMGMPDVAAYRKHLVV